MSFEIKYLDGRVDRGFETLEEAKEKVKAVCGEEVVFDDPVDINPEGSEQRILCWPNDELAGEDVCCEIWRRPRSRSRVVDDD